MAIYDRGKTIEIRGTIANFKLRNPHSSFVIDRVRFAEGAAQSRALERWEIEADATAFMKRLQSFCAPSRIHDLISSIVSWSRNGPPKGIRAPVMPEAPSSLWIT